MRQMVKNPQQRFPLMQSSIGTQLDDFAARRHPAHGALKPCTAGSDRDRSQTRCDAQRHQSALCSTTTPGRVQVAGAARQPPVSAPVWPPRRRSGEVRSVGAVNSNHGCQPQMPGGFATSRRQVRPLSTAIGQRATSFCLQGTGAKPEPRRDPRQCRTACVKSKKPRAAGRPGRQPAEVPVTRRAAATCVGPRCAR